MSTKFEFIDAEKATVTDTGEKKYTITAMCEWLDVSTSGYYEWRDRPDSATAQRRAWLSLLMKKAFDESDETYGHRRIRGQSIIGLDDGNDVVLRNGQQHKGVHSRVRVVMSRR